MKKLLLIFSCLSLGLLAGCQKEAVITEKNRKEILVAVVKSNYVYKDTTTKKVNATTNINIKTLATNSDTHLNITYLGNGNYDINPGIGVNDWSHNFGYTIRNQNNAVVYTFFHNHNDIVETVGGLTPGIYSVEVVVDNIPGTPDWDNGTYHTRTFTIAAEPTSPSGTVHLLRYVNRLTGFHFYTIDWEECASESNQYVYEMVQGYIYPTATSDPNTTAIYRYYNSSNYDHLYSHNYTTPSGYVYEGITGYCLTGPSGSFIRPLNRFNNPNTGEHFYACPPESPSGFNLEGIVGYIQ